MKHFQDLNLLIRKETNHFYIFRLYPRDIGVIMKKQLIVILLIGVAFSLSLYDQGTNARYNGTIISQGNLTIEFWNAAEGGTKLWTYTYIDAIINGSWAVPLNDTDFMVYGTKYYKNYLINGTDVNFTDPVSNVSTERLAWNAPLGNVTDNWLPVTSTMWNYSTSDLYNYMNSPYSTYSISVGKTTTPWATLDVQGSFASGYHDATHGAGGTYSTAVGYLTNASGAYSFAGGQSSLASGTNSFAFGNGANATGTGSVAIGQSANSTGSAAYAIGIIAKASGQYSLAIGYNSNSSGTSTIAIGSNADSYGTQSIAIGSASTSAGTAMGIGTTCDKSNGLALGYYANSTGWNNIAIGPFAQSTGSSAISIGQSSNSTATYSTAIGLLANANAQDSIAIGSYSNATDQDSIAIGRYANATGSGAIALGYGAVANQVYMTTITADTFLINSPNIFNLTLEGLTETGAGTDLVIDADKRVILKASSIRFKTNVTDLNLDKSKVFALNPVSFNWKSNGGYDTGLIAEEVSKQIPELVNYEKNGTPLSVKYDKLSVYLLDIVKEQQDEIDQLKELVCLDHPEAEVCKR